MGIMDWKHWIVILIVVVLVFGTKKLKGLGADVGETIKGFRKAMNDDDTAPDKTQAQPSIRAQSHQTASTSSYQNAETSIRAATE
ncbi:twin-arginine translocase TatA/TatE family subunit [Pseudomonas sp. NPDC087336]|uniref:twin-arginine translocase TatA/TatE family subunit n=1 Tax=Pseudomonas sp. NPDC087336 TaxID=3364436 RepID=UPI0038301257